MKKTVWVFKSKKPNSTNSITVRGLTNAISFRLASDGNWVQDQTAVHQLNNESSILTDGVFIGWTDSELHAQMYQRQLCTMMTNPNNMEMFEYDLDEFYRNPPFDTRYHGEIDFIKITPRVSLDGKLTLLMSAQCVTILSRLFGNTGNSPFVEGFLDQSISNVLQIINIMDGLGIIDDIPDNVIEGLNLLLIEFVSIRSGRVHLDIVRWFNHVLNQ